MCCISLFLNSLILQLLTDYSPSRNNSYPSSLAIVKLWKSPHTEPLCTGLCKNTSMFECNSWSCVFVLQNISTSSLFYLIPNMTKSHSCHSTETLYLKLLTWLWSSQHSRPFGSISHSILLNRLSSLGITPSLIPIISPSTLVYSL